MNESLGHLRALVENGGAGAGQRYVEGTCNYCGCWEGEPHKADCIWLAARAFLRELEDSATPSEAKPITQIVSGL